MSGIIFLLQEGAKLVKMEEAPYNSEGLLQELLANHPDLLAGDQIDTEEPRRWLLISREMPVPGQENGAGRWSLDHLFLDQDAIPTLVEVKRSSDLRLRREVVGQMLDYAANAVAYWPVEQIKAKFETRCEGNGIDPEEELGVLCGKEQDVGEFWQQVKTNLQAGRIRMVFLADIIPSELRRVVEFLNEQMDPAEVLAIEIKQFVGEGMKTLVPRVLGQTEIARQKKAPGSTGRVNATEAEFLSSIAADRTAEEQSVIRRLIDWSREHGLDDSFRKGQKGISFIPELRHADRQYYPISVRQRGPIAIQMRWLKKDPPFNDALKRDQLFDRIKDIPGLQVADAGMEGFPKIPVSTLLDPEYFRRFIESLGWIVQEIRRSARTNTLASTLSE
jgi:hypothetical protein